MALGHVPLADIIAELVRERAHQNPNIEFSHSVEELRQSYGDTLDLTVYRCVQEALTNALRHAGARRIEVRAAQANRIGGEAQLDLEIRDDGKGMAADVPRGFGLSGMRERVQALGGEFAIDTGPGRGTTLRIAIPLTAERSAAAADYASNAS